MQSMTLWAAIIALLVFSCKPIVREETSEEQYAFHRLHRMFVHLVERGSYAPARTIFDAKLLRNHSPGEAHHLIRSLANSGDSVRVPSFFASWVQESTRVAQGTLLEISNSRSPAEVEKLLQELDEQIIKVRRDFIKQREAITTVKVEDGMYRLTTVIDALDAARHTELGKYIDFNTWAKDFQQKLDKSFFRDGELNDKPSLLSNEKVKQAWRALEARFAPLPRPFQ